MDEDEPGSKARDLTAEIVASFVANNALRSSELPEFIELVYYALIGLERPKAAAPMAATELIKPVSIKKSRHNDYLISMEDGKQYKSLKRHLAGRGLTPIAYRTKWGLPNDYPMTAPAYSERRAELARSFGLGRKPTGAS